ncbi:unknown protein [Azorhizobium caulinodans ORS 571]|uniref:Winged helix-turn-helix domain-containing protein n=1 Tax=Azorhizobium caulinodans (strain ATCC 43989 / DSM 5975 / JCM 20966 / LMG 6465 / NBRC 14845 / NCIMB 13405 / ORS 571) TaxID=438753 RepID=A8IFC1_AZOC5|nr:helix-turn-helix domain-containing protein [Azorhizobium caulinodans]BAF89598.1 unknown protein [Azorhizobium caulinodans ORS 571]
MSDFTKSLNLSPLARRIFAHLERTGSISAREAMADYGITSATLSRRICEMEGAGIEISRERRIHPMTGRRYTRYALASRKAA